MFQHTLKSQAPKKARRAGRGNAAGRGTTAGRGTKGQLSRKGNRTRIGFEGGQTPLLQRQPKLGGFKNPNKIEYEVINLSTLEAKLPAGAYDSAALREQKVTASKRPVKILGKGEVKKKFELTVAAASKSAQEAIKKAGGKIELKA